jgi:hypothetical protein
VLEAQLLGYEGILLVFALGAAAAGAWYTLSLKKGVTGSLGAHH